MRLRAWACCRPWLELARRVCWLWWALAGLCVLPAARADVLELRSAQVWAQVRGVTTHTEVRLPYNWDQRQGNRPGEAVFEIPFVLPAPVDQPYGVYFPRVGNTAEVWLNGVLLAQWGSVHATGQEDYAKAPQYALIPQQLLQADNVFRVVLHADGGRRGGLSPLLVGPAAEVSVQFRQAYRWRVTGSLVVAVFSLLVGVIALILWRVDRAQGVDGQFQVNAIYLSAGLAELCWVIRLSDLGLEQPPLAWPWWGMLQTLAFAGWLYGVALFCHQAAGWQGHPSMRWLRRFLLGLVLSAGPVSYWALTGHHKLYVTVWYGVASFFFVGYGVAYAWMAARRPSTERVMVAVAGGLNVVVGVRDWLVIRASDNFEESTWIRYSSLLFGLTLLYIVLTRFYQARRQARELMAHMEDKVREKERALVASYLQFEELTRQQARSEERTRILRDMHDGVGSHISAAIRQLQSGKASQAELLQTLRDSLDQLKLSIDAMHLPPGDVTALLANLRYRLEPRFKASDIELQWDVDLLAPLAGLDDKAMRQLQFMVFEALSNVLQHARASVLRIELKARSGGGAQLRVVDNGVGFDPARDPQRGLGSLRKRAAAIGARLTVRSVPGQTVVEIGLSGGPAG